MKEYYSIPLEDEEAQALLDISLLTDKAVRSIPFIGDIYTAIKGFDLRSKETYWYENHNIVRLYFYHSDLRHLPECIGNL